MVEMSEKTIGSLFTASWVFSAKVALSFKTEVPMSRTPLSCSPRETNKGLSKDYIWRVSRSAFLRR